MLAGVAGGKFALFVALGTGPTRSGVGVVGCSVTSSSTSMDSSSYVARYKLLETALAGVSTLSFEM